MALFSRRGCALTISVAIASLLALSGCGGSGGSTGTRTLFVGTLNGLAISQNGGASWTANPVLTGGESAQVQALCANSSGIYVSYRGSSPTVHGVITSEPGGLAVSRNGGQSWTYDLQVDNQSITGVWGSGSTIYATSDPQMMPGLRKDDRTNPGGLWISRDGGSS